MRHDEPNRAGDERLTGDMDRLPHSLAALGSSSSFLISWSNRSSVSRSLSPCVVSFRSLSPASVAHFSLSSSSSERSDVSEAYAE